MRTGQLTVMQRTEKYREHPAATALIVSDPEIMGGAPVIRGTRITVAAILGRIEGGDSVENILEDYPYLDSDIVTAAAVYARANPSAALP